MQKVPSAAADPAVAPDVAADESIVLSDSLVEAVVSSAGSSLGVRRRHQFFVWTQSSLQALLPHQLAACGAYSRGRRELLFDVFNGVPLPEPVLAELGDSRSALLVLMQTLWLNSRCKPVSLRVQQLQGEAQQGLRQALQAAGFAELLAHGVSRPQRPSEIESFFLFATGGPGFTQRHRFCLELLMPHIHSTWLRVQGVERDIKAAPPSPLNRKPGAVGITEREREVLTWLHEGMSNQQIGEVLGISCLTVKNHVQKILRKLNAANRAQAVALAIGMELLNRGALPQQQAPTNRLES